MASFLSGFDFTEFWEPSRHALVEYVGRSLDCATVRSVEEELGLKLPPSYIEFMAFQNGGIPRRTCHRTTEPTSWARDHIAISGLYSIGRDKPCSLCGELSTRFWIEEWGYPPIGVYFADCPSGGHDMVCLDYSECGPNGEPRVVHVDQELDYKVVVLANCFESFIRGLEHDSAFDPEV